MSSDGTAATSTNQSPTLTTIASRSGLRFIDDSPSPSIKETAFGGSSSSADPPMPAHHQRFKELVARLEEATKDRPDPWTTPEPDKIWASLPKPRRLPGVLYPQDTPPASPPPPQDSLCTRCLLIFWPCNVWTALLAGLIWFVIVLAIGLYAKGKIAEEDAIFQAKCKLYRLNAPFGQQRFVSDDGSLAMEFSARPQRDDGVSHEFHAPKFKGM